MTTAVDGIAGKEVKEKEREMAKKEDSKIVKHDSQNVVSQRQKVLFVVDRLVTSGKELNTSSFGVNRYVRICIRRHKNRIVSGKMEMKTKTRKKSDRRKRYQRLVVTTPSRQGPVIFSDTAPESPDANNREEGK